jgi:hypothetical protein
MFGIHPSALQREVAGRQGRPEASTTAGYRRTADTMLALPR